MNKLIVGLVIAGSLFTYSCLPAEASIKSKVKAVALFGPRIVKYGIGGALAGIGLAMTFTFAEWEFGEE